MATIDENILIHYMDGTLSREQQAEVESWLADSPDNEKLLEQIYYTLQITSRLRVVESVDADQALLRFKSRVNRQNRKVSMHRALLVLQQVAAVLLIPVFVMAAYLFLQQGESQVRMVEVRTNPGVVSLFNLPDGSKVWLNAGSRLTYPSDFTADSRVVELAGQGYFEVTKNPSKPFIVKAGADYSVEVLGTSFDVAAYHDDEQIETTLIEGAVKLTIAGLNGPDISQELKPNEKAEYKKGTNQLEVSTVNTDYDTAWKNGEIIFRNHPMSQVIKVLGRHFHVKFVVLDPEVMNSIITARFKEEQLPQVMEYIRLASGITYEIKKSSISANHTLEEPIIEISKK